VKVIRKEKGGVEATGDGRKFALSIGGGGCWKCDEKERKG